MAAKAYDLKARELGRAELNFEEDEAGSEAWRQAARTGTGDGDRVECAETQAGTSECGSDGTDNDKKGMYRYSTAWSKRKHRGVAQISVNKKQRHIGCFKDERAAARAYDEYSDHAQQQCSEDNDAALQPRQSKYRGVTWTKSGKWQVQIWEEGKMEYLGTFEDQEDAAHVFDRRAIELGRQANFAHSDTKHGSTSDVDGLDSSSEDGEYEVEQIVDRKRLGRIFKYLIKWVGYDELSWEPEECLVGCKDMLKSFLADLNAQRPLPPYQKIAPDVYMLKRQPSSDSSSLGPKGKGPKSDNSRLGPKGNESTVLGRLGTTSSLQDNNDDDESQEKEPADAPTLHVSRQWRQLNPSHGDTYDKYTAFR